MHFGRLCLVAFTDIAPTTANTNESRRAAGTGLKKEEEEEEETDVYHGSNTYDLDAALAETKAAEPKSGLTVEQSYWRKHLPEPPTEAALRRHAKRFGRERLRDRGGLRHDRSRSRACWGEWRSRSSYLGHDARAGACAPQPGRRSRRYRGHAERFRRSGQETASRAKGCNGLSLRFLPLRMAWLSQGK
jgi:hypothetical protein